MADNRTGLSPADIAENFRDRCGDGSVEWTYTPMQTWVLLDAADMLDENAKLVMKLNAEHLVRQNVERENAKLRELVRDMHKALFSLNLDHCQACPREDTCVFIHECAFERDMRELGIEVDG